MTDKERIAELEAELKAINKNDKHWAFERLDFWMEEYSKLKSQLSAQAEAKDKVVEAADKLIKESYIKLDDEVLTLFDALNELNKVKGGVDGS